MWENLIPNPPIPQIRFLRLQNAIFQSIDSPIHLQSYKASAMKNSDPYRIMHAITNMEHIGTPPELAFRLFAIAKKETSSIEQIAQEILKNPTVSAALLKLSNSAYYSRGLPIENVHQAIVHLGTKTVINLIVAIEMIGTFENREDRSSFNINQYWKRSLALALLAQEIALLERREDTESAFLSGLLYDIGVLVLRQYFPDAFAEICELMSGKKCCFAEACGTIGYLDHHQIGRLIAMRWNLPKKILYLYSEPSTSLLDYVEVTANRNTVLFSDCQLTLNGIYAWDAHQKADLNLAKLFAPGENFLKDFLKRLVSDVHEIRAAM